MKRLLTIVLILCMTGFLYELKALQKSDFTLIILGKGITDQCCRVELMQNPGVENRWIRMNESAKQTYSYQLKSGANLYVITGISSDVFVGQDIRENYIALRISRLKHKTPENVQFRGAWAVQDSTHITPAVLKQWAQWIQRDPEKMQKLSLASTVYPRTQAIGSDKSFIEHIELPVRHLKAGVQEVRWLEILFSGDQ